MADTVRKAHTINVFVPYVLKKINNKLLYPYIKLIALYATQISFLTGFDTLVCGIYQKNKILMFYI